MFAVLKYLKFVPIIALLAVFTCGMLPYQQIANSVGDAIPTPALSGTAPSGTIPVGTTGECGNVGVSYPGNPFSGWPVSGGSYSYVTADYCDPMYFFQFGRNHKGIDLGYPSGTPVLATADVIVTRVEHDHEWRGHNVEVCTGSSWCATYMHLSRIEVSEWDAIAPGGKLGEVGSTGNSTGPHLHYELYDPAFNRVDPITTMP